MRQPSRNSTYGKHGGEEICGNAHAVVERGGIEIYIRMQILFIFHHIVNFNAHIEKVGLAHFLAQFLRHLAQDLGTRIAVLIDSMTKTHNLFFALQRLLKPAFHLGRIGDSLKHAHYLLIGAAVEGAFQGTYRASDRGVNIGARGSSHPRREGGGVHRVIGMKY